MSAVLEFTNISRSYKRSNAYVELLINACIGAANFLMRRDELSSK
jgi:hypothetical protein